MKRSAAHFAEFGRNLGIAFQIRDDILGIWGDPDVTGKSAATDILSRKKSLPVLYGLAQSSACASFIAASRSARRRSAKRCSILDDVHAQEYALERGNAYYQQAMQALERANPQGEAAQGLLQLVEALFQRQAVDSASQTAGLHKFAEDHIAQQPPRVGQPDALVIDAQQTIAGVLADHVAVQVEQINAEALGESRARNAFLRQPHPHDQRLADLPCPIDHDRFRRRPGCADIHTISSVRFVQQL